MISQRLPNGASVGTRCAPYFIGTSRRLYHRREAPDKPSEKALLFAIRQDDDYSKVANGVPRAEINFAPRIRFQQGKEYWISWSSYLPSDFVFDSKQPEGIGQIHEGPNQGIPPWGISLKGAAYEVNLGNGKGPNQTLSAGSATNDRGKWVEWSLHYRPDSSCKQSIPELSKDGAEVLRANGKPNAYPADDMAYLKLGIYKWWWQARPSDATEDLFRRFERRSEGLT